MNSNIFSALISGISSLAVGILTFAGVLVSNNRANHKSQMNLDKAQAITKTQLEELTREVRMHNDFARRIPVIEEKIKVINHRVDDLEHLA